MRFTALMTLYLIVTVGSSDAHADSARWSWGMEESNPDSNGGPMASMEERDGKGDPLMLTGCSEGTLRFVDGPQSDFWINEAIGTSSAHLGFLKFNVDSQKSIIPYLAEPGMDGDYFTLDLEGAAGGLKRADGFSLCPTEGSEESRCRYFSLVGFAEAVKFVCQAHP